MAKLVDALDLGSSAARRGGSSPSTRTNYFRGISSVGRAPDLHSGGQRFEPAILHQTYKYKSMSGCSSVVEFLVANEIVVSSNLITRSNL